MFQKVSESHKTTLDARSAGGPGRPAVFHRSSEDENRQVIDMVRGSGILELYELGDCGIKFSQLKVAMWSGWFLTVFGLGILQPYAHTPRKPHKRH